MSPTARHRGAAGGQRSRARSVVARLVEACVLEDGRLLHLRLDGEVSAALRDAVHAWVAAHPARGRAAWVNEPPRCLVWALDATAYTASGLVAEIALRAVGRPVRVAGARSWVDVDGVALYELLEHHVGEPAYAEPTTGRDWSRLHQLLATMPDGHWTSYKDLAAAIGSSPIAVGRHLSRCDDCPRAYRVLTSRGTVADGFCWSEEGRDDDPMQLLRAEGVDVDERGRAHPAQRCSW